jgi:SAM-dependent methyltransferase
MAMTMAAQKGYGERACPVCGSCAKELIFSQSFEELGGVGLLSGYDVVICDDCGAGFADHIPSQSALDKYYRDLSKYEYQHRGGQESNNDEPRFLEVAGILPSFVFHRTDRILDIGCATGRLLSLLKQRGYHEVFGLDPSPGCAEAARRLFGVEVFTGTIFDLPSSGSYDFLILLGVVEHIRDLGPALAKVRDLLSTRGRAYIEVPDAVHPPARAEAPFQEFSTEHINFFSVVSLTNLLAATGFQKIACEYALREYPPGASTPVVWGVFEKSAAKAAAFCRDRGTKNGLLEYIRKCREMDAALVGGLGTLVDSETHIIIWGVGTLTRRLLASGALAKMNIAGFVDSNPKYHGQLVHGLPVFAPDEMKQHPEPILILSYAFQDEILRQIRTELGLSNQVLRLHEVESGS